MLGGKRSEGETMGPPETDIPKLLVGHDLVVMHYLVEMGKTKM